MSSRLTHYVVAGLFPLAAAVFWLAFVPPIWFGTDSTTMLVWPTFSTPHYPPLYMLAIYAFEQWFGINPAMLQALFVVQHLLLVLSVVYLASAFQTVSRILIVSVAATAGAQLGMWAHTVATQAFEGPFLIFMLGAVLRYHKQGWRLGLAPVLLLSALGLAITRHADVVLAALVPAYWLWRAIFAKLYRSSEASTSRRYLVNTGICAVGVLLVIACMGPIQYLTCRFFGSECPYSIVGQAGCYRISATYGRVPNDQKASWLADKTAGLPAPEAAAFKTMTDGNLCWFGARDHIAKLFPNRDPDAVLDGAFYRMLLRPDRYAIAQMWHEFKNGLYANHSAYYGFVPFTNLIYNSSKTVAQNVDQRHHDMRAKVGAKPATDAPYFRALSQNPVLVAYDNFTFYWLNLIVVAGLIVVLLFDRRPSVLALGASLISTGLLYLAAVAAVTVVLYPYVFPVNILMYVWLGILGCLVVDAIAHVARRNAKEGVA